MPRFLSDSDVTKLRRLIADVGVLRGQIRTLHERGKGADRAGGHYVVLTPSGGIPAASGSPLVPGKADCLIQWAAGSTREVTDTTRPEKVYNLSTSAIGGGELLIAHRDNWGDLWVDSPSGSCPDIGLSPGSYPAVAGDAIPAGSTGPVSANGIVIEAVNHSKCDVEIGDPIGLHISPNCNPFFVPCVCCDEQPDPDPTCATEYPCCRTPFAFCLQKPFVDGAFAGTYTGFASLKDTVINVPGPYDSPFTLVCSDGSQIFLQMVMTCCDEGTPSVAWEVRNLASEVISSGSFSVAGLCDEPPVIERHEIDVPGGCSMLISFGEAYSDELCGNTGPPTSPCCEQSLYFCYNNDSQLLPVDGGSYTWSVPGCCPGPAADLEVELSCDPETDTITMSGKYICNEEEFPFSETTEMSKFCDSGQARIIILDNIPCLIQMLVSTVQFNCAPVPGDETTTPPITTPPPPPPMEI